MSRPRRRTRLLSTCALLAAAALGVSAAQGQVAGPSYAFVNGRWLDHGHFVARSWWSVNGVLTDHAPAHVDSTIDLRGGWVIPPFGDAHTHNLDGPFNLDSVRAAYLREGTFYVQVLANSRAGAASVRNCQLIPCIRFERTCTKPVSESITASLIGPCCGLRGGP